MHTMPSEILLLHESSWHGFNWKATHGIEGIQIAVITSIKVAQVLTGHKMPPPQSLGEWNSFSSHQEGGLVFINFFPELGEC